MATRAHFTKKTTGDKMKDWSGNKTAVYVTNGDSSHSTRERETRDYYATDPRAVTELLKRETFCNEILEPACGGGTFQKY